MIFQLLQEYSDSKQRMILGSVVVRLQNKRIHCVSLKIQIGSYSMMLGKHNVEHFAILCLSRTTIVKLRVEMPLALMDSRTLRHVRYSYSLQLM